MYVQILKRNITGKPVQVLLIGKLICMLLFFLSCDVVNYNIFICCD